jgi:hypothetical protein
LTGAVLVNPVDVEAPQNAPSAVIRHEKRQEADRD